MNQEKIGKFIATLRKNNNFTQQDLADKLGVSKNAVSKWERGICLMDISLLKPISKIFNISISELLNGEKIEQEITSYETEEIIEKAIDYSTKEIKKAKNLKSIKIIIIIIMFSLILSLTLIKIFNNVKENNFIDLKEGYRLMIIETAKINNNINILSLKEGDKIDIIIEDPNNNSALFNTPLISNVQIRKLKDSNFENTSKIEDVAYIEVAIPYKYVKVFFLITASQMFNINVAQSIEELNTLNDEVKVNDDLYDFIMSEYFIEIPADET